MPKLKPRGRNDSHIFDYSKITEQIYIGSDLCKGGVCKIHGEEFKSLRVTVEVNLSQEGNELPPKDIETYAWIPVVDGYSPTQAQLDMGTSIINEAIKGDKRVYVHCRNGHARSPTLVAAYLIRFKGMSLDEVTKLIKEKRPETHIEAAQIEELKRFWQRWSK